jgi:PEP-CTERM motif-containing protein
MRRLALLTVASVILLLPGRAVFADTFGSSCTGATTGVNLATQDASGLVTPTLVSNAGSCGASSQNSSTVTVIEDDQPFSFAQTGSASASARASLGSLGAKASADASSTPASYTFTNSSGESQSVDDSAFSVAGASASAMWFDTFTNSNPDTLELQLFSVFDASASGGGSASGQTTAIFQVGCSSSPFSLFGGCDSVITIGDGTTVWLDPGAVMQVTAQIGAQATAASGLISCGLVGQCFIGAPPPQYFPPESATADAFNTLGFYINVVGGCGLSACDITGETYNSGSGYIYSQAALAGSEVPEPSSIFLFGSGLAGLAAAWGKRLRGLPRRKESQ